MDRIRTAIAEWIAPHTEGMSADELTRLFATPPKDKEAECDLALPCFQVKVAGEKAPPAKAAKLAQALPAHPLVERAGAAGPYVNVTLRPAALAAQVLPAFDALAAGGFTLADGGARTLTMDYSSPNVAKEFSLGHLRSTMLGHSLIRLYEAAGWKTVGVNHLGDWGHQFGVVIVAFRDEGNEKLLQGDPIPYLQALYQKYSLREKAEKKRADAEAAGKGYDALKAFNPAAVKDPAAARALAEATVAADDYLRQPLLPTDAKSVTARARATDDALQAGDKTMRALWQRFRDLSVKALDATYARLGVHFDAWTGESFFEDKMAPVVAELRQKTLLAESRGAQVVWFEPAELGLAKKPKPKPGAGDDEGDEVTDDGRAGVMVLKSGGGTVYLTRDLAAAEYRAKTYRFAKNVYVVDARQSDHFRNVFAVLRRMGRPWADQCVHVAFGTVRIDGAPMSTRLGNVVLVEDYVADNTARVVAIMQEKNPGLAQELGAEGYAATARDVAQGAIVFEMLKVDRTQDVNYVSQQALSFDGATGPRVQMIFAKTGSVLRKYQEAFGKPADERAFDPAHYTTVWERNLIRLIGDYPKAVRDALATHQPAVIARYALDIAEWLNKYWTNVLFVDRDNPAAAASRVALLARLRKLVKQCLHLLGLKAPERM